MIRIATEADFDTILSMSMKFAEGSNYTKFVSEEKLKNIISIFINSSKHERVIFLNDDKGMLVACVTPFIFGDVKNAVEVAWWVEKEYRRSNVGRELIEAFEIWGKEVGCTILTMSSVDDTVGKFYEKNGYSLYERSYFKEI